MNHLVNRPILRYSEIKIFTNHYKAQLITYDVIMKNNGKVRDVRSLACKNQGFEGLCWELDCWLK